MNGRSCSLNVVRQEFTNGPFVRRALENTKQSPLVSKIKNISLWSYPDAAAAAGPAAATSAAASVVCIYPCTSRPPITT